MMIFKQSQSPTEAVLLAKVGVWRELLARRPIVPGRGVVSHQLRPGETITEADWKRVVSLVNAAIANKENDAVARVRIPAEMAGPLLDMARV